MSGIVKAGNRPVLSLVNHDSGIASMGSYATKEILSGALNAGVYKTVLSVTGAGFVDVLAAISNTGTARNIGLRLTIDGTVVHQKVVDGSGYGGQMAVGVFSTTTYSSASTQRIEFNSSMLVEVSSNLTETDGVKLKIIYGTRK